MKNLRYLRYLYLGFFLFAFSTETASAQMNKMFGKLLGEKSDSSASPQREKSGSKSANPFGKLFGSGKKSGSKSANPLGKLFGAGKMPGMPGMPGGKGGKGGFSGAFADAMQAAKNTNLGPVGRFVLGRKLSAMVVGGYKTVSLDDPRIPYIKNVALTLLANSRYFGSYKNTIVVLLQADKVINAFAAPGGFIFVTTGMLNFLENEDELAFILAHEVAHIELDHGLNAIIQQQSGKIFAKATKSFGMGTAFDQMISFAENGYSEDVEAEADIRGAELASNTGYDFNSAIAVITRLEKVTGRKHATGYPANRAKRIKNAARNIRVLEKSVAIRARRFSVILPK